MSTAFSRPPPEENLQCMYIQTYHKLVPPTTTTITVLGPDGFAAGKNNAEWALIAFQFFKIVPKRKRNQIFEICSDNPAPKNALLSPTPQSIYPGGNSLTLSATVIQDPEEEVSKKEAKKSCGGGKTFFLFLLFLARGRDDLSSTLQKFSNHQRPPHTHISF